MNVATAARTAGRILVVDDEASVSSLLRDLLTGEGYAVSTAESGRGGLAALDAEVYDIVLLDLRLPDIDGMSVLAAARSMQPDAQVVMLSGNGSVAHAVEAMKLGALDYIIKPFDISEVVLVVARAMRELALRRDVARLNLLTQDRLRQRLVGHHRSMERLFDAIAQVAPRRTSVLISGETGTGKEVVARLLHEMSDRHAQPFVAVHCAALSETLLESELFGHVKGAFTGALAARRGLFEEAGGGTLFLDEVSTIPPSVQVKLLRVLQERVVHRVGSSQPIAVDFRLVAASNVDLLGEVQAGRFREDLYYRLNVYPVALPPLRERRSDIPLLVHHFAQHYAREHGVAPPRISEEVLDRMMVHDWPGNVRELEHFVERAVVVHAGGVMPFEPPRTVAGGAAPGPGADFVRQGRDAGWDLARLEREYIVAALDATAGHQSRAAELLGIDRRTLLRKLKEYEAAGIRTPRQRRGA